MWKARGPNDWLCHGIESREVEDERVDFISANEWMLWLYHEASESHKDTAAEEKQNVKMKSVIKA